MTTPKTGSWIRLFFGGLWPRIPILHRYISRELLLVGLLTTTLLTSLLALCGLLQPLRKHGVTASELMEIMMLLFPFFLIFTVPFALMLACCWVYGRLAADNELWACSSSGINIQRLLIVPLVLGLLAMILNGFLANWLVPNWALDRFEALLGRHGKDIVYRELSRSGSFSLDPQQIGRRCVIHADEIYPNQDVLKGIAVAVFGKDSQRVERIITASKAELEFYSSGKDSGLPDSIAIVPLQASIVELPEYHSYKAASLVFSGRIRQTIRQHFSAMSLGDLVALGQDAERYNAIADLASRARRIFIAHELVKKLHSDLDRDGYFELSSPQGRYRFTGQPVQAVFNEEGAKNILGDATVKQYDLDSPRLVRIFADVGQLNLELIELPQTTDGKTQLMTASMVLRNTHIQRPSAGGEINNVLERTRFSISELALPGDVVKRGRGLSLEKIKRGSFGGPAPQRLLQLGRQITKRQNKLTKKITLEIHSRLAIAASCPVLAVLGALLGAIFRKGQFLVAVGLSLAPAVVALLFIIMGQRMVDSEVFSTGVAVGVAWTGLILLGIAIAVLFVKVLRR